MNGREAVFQACDELGDKTSLDVLHRKAQNICDWQISRSTTYQYRLKWRKARGVKNHDCRTYKTQHRRNMLNDSVATLPQVKRINHVLSLKRVTPVSLLNLLGHDKEAFHSIDQLRNAVEELIELRKAA